MRRSVTARDKEGLMRKRSIGMVVALVLSAVAMAFGAQQQGRMGKMGKRGKANIEKRVAHMKADLNLTDQQASQVKELFEKHEQERQAWRGNNPNATREEMRTHRQKMYRQMNEGLKKILTPEQYKKHEEMMHRRMHHRMHPGPKGPPQN